MNGFLAFLSVFNVIGLVAFSFGQFGNGKVKKNTDEIAAANTAIDVLTKSNITLKESLAEEKALRLKDHDELIGLKKDLEHSKSDNEKLMATLELRNPEMTTFMQLLTTTSAQASEYMKTTSENLKAINQFMVKIDGQLLVLTKH